MQKNLWTYIKVYKTLYLPFYKPSMDYNLPITSFQGLTVPDAKFSILIPTWNNIDFLKICVESILKNSTEKHEIIIHINEGNDGTIAYVKEKGFSFTQSKENVGVCYAMNAMGKLATTDYILYMNDDMYACPNWDLHLINAIKAQKDDLFYFSSTMIEPTFSKNKCVIAPHDFGTSKEDFEEEKLIAFTNQISKKDWFGASWPPSVMHKRLWDKVGGYSVEFSPGYGSDPDLSMKLWNAGVRNYKGIGKSLVYHFQSKSTGRVIKNNGRLMFASKWGFPSSHLYKKVLKLGETFNHQPLTFKKDYKYGYAKIRAMLMQLKK